jgi:hypothetical protein
LSIDTDGDGLLDQIDNICTNPLDADSDDDGIPDGTEDSDHDGIYDFGETDPCDIDTDDDGIQDGTELCYSQDDIGPDTNPGLFVPDADPDTTTNPIEADTDGDGLSDGEEDANFNGKVDPGETDPNLGQCASDFESDCDVNKDDKVDGLDFIIFRNEWGSTGCNDMNKICLCDFNSDGKVDGLDFVLFRNNWGKQCP